MGRTAIITGAANGIGRTIAASFAENGCNVVIADIDVKNGKALQDQLVQKGLEASFIQCDLADPGDIRRLVNETVSRYKEIHVLINNAGVSGFTPPDELTADGWDRILNVNLRSSFLLTSEAAAEMKKCGGGAVVNIASTRALMSEKNSEAYAASKGGLLALTHAMALSFADDHVRVNCISPGWIHTGDYSTLRDIDHEQHPSGRVGRPGRHCQSLSFSDRS
jgi:NAD(P)-dependent dehydrogenase (short-subunit alcohol dehydrogenase family)